MAQLLTVQEPVLAGITPTYAAADVTGDEFVYTGGDILIQWKNSGAEHIATIVTPATIEGLAIANPTVTVPLTTGDKMVKLNSPGGIYVASTGKISLTYDGVAGLTVAVFKV